MVKAAIMNSLRKLVSNQGVENCMVLTKTGVIRVTLGQISDSAKEDMGTFLATIYGGAIESNKLINKGYPKKVTIEDSEGYTIIRVIEKGLFLSIRVKLDTDLEKLSKEIENARWTILNEL